MTYMVKSVFLTQQGEGANIGRVAVFIRFAGCNLWSGRAADRATAACRFCDTDFVGGTRFDAAALADAAAALWPGRGRRFCVLTGGEPLLQVDETLLSALRRRGFFIAIETNGTQPLPADCDWVCCSPKAGAPVVLDRADELKIAYPQRGLNPQDFATFDAPVRWLSPIHMDGRTDEHTAAAIAYCLQHPEWRLAIQAHKYWGIR